MTNKRELVNLSTARQLAVLAIAAGGGKTDAEAMSTAIVNLTCAAIALTKCGGISYEEWSENTKRLWDAMILVAPENVLSSGGDA